MKKDELIKIIKEEFSNSFDFLGNDKQIKENEFINVLTGEEFQKQFIVDSITNMRNTIKITNNDISVTNDPDLMSDDYHNDLDIECLLEISYTPPNIKSPVKFGLSFIGNKINYSTSVVSSQGSYDIPNTSDASYSSINWDEIFVSIYTIDGQDVDFVAFKRAPEKIQELFIRSYVEPIIENYTDIGDVREPKPSFSKF
jgi:hypothetical protein